jgi:hypothetical protein
MTDGIEIDAASAGLGALGVKAARTTTIWTGASIRNPGFLLRRAMIQDWNDFLSKRGST